MLITIIRLVVLYCMITLALRLMGKRQVGELKPTELVVTILLSELAVMPIQDNSLPMTTALVAAAVLVSLEIISSVIATHSTRFRKVTQGSSIVIIQKGKLDLNELANLRIAYDDLMEALRQKDVFDITHVQTALMETNGQISVELKPEHQPLKKEDQGNA
ncbi:MAG: DUF421 domain-containing protein [Oscillospiraceae bacterium]|nr:DUF421 domain-containing protein [Oscillospiraceae bacterium]